MKILSILTLLFGFTQCTSTKFIKNPSFKVTKAVYNNWSGGQPGVGGIKLVMHLKNAKDIAFDSVYFQKKITKIEVTEKENAMHLIGHFTNSKSVKRDLILDADPTKELKNTPPLITKFPFDLKENEAVLTYKKGNKTVYFKLENIKKVQPKFFPSANKK